MAIENQEFLGRFASGERPPPLEHTYKDLNDVALDLTGYTSAVRIEATDGVGKTLGTGVLGWKDDDPTTGAVLYEWSADDMTDPGFYRLQLWVYEGTTKFASDVFTYIVYDGPGVAP